MLQSIRKLYFCIQIHIVNKNPNPAKLELRIKHGCTLIRRIKTDKKNTTYFDFKTKHILTRINELELRIRIFN